MALGVDDARRERAVVDDDDAILRLRRPAAFVGFRPSNSRETVLIGPRVADHWATLPYLPPVCAVLIFGFRPLSTARQAQAVMAATTREGRQTREPMREKYSGAYGLAIGSTPTAPATDGARASLTKAKPRTRAGPTPSCRRTNPTDTEDSAKGSVTQKRHFNAAGSGRGSGGKEAGISMARS